jgi:hypothetical protein
MQSVVMGGVVVIGNPVTAVGPSQIRIHVLTDIYLKRIQSKDIHIRVRGAQAEGMIHPIAV